jgi:hypothetical protein
MTEVSPSSVSAMLRDVSADAEDREVEEIRAFFEAKHRRLLIHEQAGSWEAIIPIEDYPSFPPYATGQTRIAAARNALALWRERPDLGGLLDRS